MDTCLFDSVQKQKVLPPVKNFSDFTGASKNSEICTQYLYANSISFRNFSEFLETGKFAYTTDLQRVFCL